MATPAIDEMGKYLAQAHQTRRHVWSNMLVPGNHASSSTSEPCLSVGAELPEYRPAFISLKLPRPPVLCAHLLHCFATSIDSAHGGRILDRQEGGVEKRLLGAMPPPSSPATVAEAVLLSQQDTRMTKAHALPKLDNNPPHPSPLLSQGRSVVEHWSPASTARSTSPLDVEKVPTPNPQAAAVVAHKDTHVDGPGALPLSLPNHEVEVPPTFQVGEGSTPNPPQKTSAVGSSHRHTTELGRLSRKLLRLVDRRQRGIPSNKVGPSKRSAVLDAALRPAVPHPEDVTVDEGKSKPPGATPPEELVIRHRVPASRGNDDEVIVESGPSSPAVVAASSRATAEPEGEIGTSPIATAAAEASVAPSSTVWKKTAVSTETMDTLAGEALDQGLVLPCAPSDGEKVRVDLSDMRV